MKAAICRQLDAPVTVEEVELAGPLRGEVRVRMVATGVCHSDLSVITGTIGMRLPCVLGHEGAGVVEEVGEGVDHLAPGDKVVLAWVLACGACFFCRAGQPHLCEVADKVNRTNRMPDGSSRLTLEGKPLSAFSALGALAEQAVVPARAAVKLPPQAPLDRCALLGCAVATGTAAVFSTARVTPGSSVAVLGAGGVGLNAIQAAAIAGAARIIAVDAQAGKLPLARTLGATDAVDASQGDPVEAVRALTAGRGADFVIEAVGKKATIEQAYAATRRGGTCVVVGLGSPKESLALSVFGLTYYEKKLLGSWYGGADVHRDIPRLWALVEAGKLRLDPLVTRTYALAEVNQAFADLKAGSNARGVVVF